MILTAVMLLGLFAGVFPSRVYAATTSQNNIVARADYLYNIKWTAKSTVYGWNGNYVFKAGTSYRIPYGQPINSGYYIGYGVSVDDFVAAAKTAGSIYYTSRSTYYDGGSSSVYFATDCSAFVSWCWGVSRKTTYSIPQVSTYIGMATASNAYSLQLGDCLNSNDVGHVVLVTDLVYSGSTLTKIEITEQTPPQLKRSTYTPSELGAKYGAYYGIYRYYGTVPAAPSSSSGSTGSDVISPGASSTITTKYYPACPSSSSYLYEGMANIGVQLNWELQCEIAEANSITDFSGTAEQNEEMLNLLKAGKLLNPDYVDTTPSTPTTKNYYPACASSCATLYAGLADIGVTLNWDLQCRIAEANGITNFSGTAEQNNQMLALLKAGKLIDPDNTSTSTPTTSYYPACASSCATLYAGLANIGVTLNWDLQCRIAEANGITNFSGTAEQNNQMLALLKAGQLVDPDKASSAPSTPTTPSTPSTSSYYDACSSSTTTLFAGMEEIGVYLDWNLQCEIAEANGITNFSGTAEQNNKLLALLKAGKLLKPGYVATNYYAACDSSCGNLYEGMENIGVTLDWDLQCSIAKVNGIDDFSGTIEQNTVLLDLLKAGKLIIPGTVTDGDPVGGGSTGDSVVDGDNGYDRGYAGGKNGTGEYVAFGLDVSSWQGSNLDFKKIKNAGYDFVILRAGTTKGKDTLFETYYTKARAAGLDIGAYYYSYATDTGTAARDAEDMLTYISGKTFEYPIYFDYEDASQQSLSSNTSKAICLTFMDKLAEEGYLVGIYTGSYFSTLLPMSEICKRYEFWVAHYVASGGNGYDGTDDYTVYGPKYSTQSGMYQYTDSVWIGNYGPYDGDVCYKDYPSIVKKYGFNGYAPAHTHSYKGTVTTKATCVADGVKTFTCSGCGDSYTEKIPATGHNYKAVVTEPTCTTKGKTVYTCSKCSDSYTERIPALGHSYKAVVTEPTCTTDGYTTYTCSTCSDSYTDSATSSTGHSYKATVTTKATCEADGVKTYKCAGCGDSYTEKIPSTGHNYKAVVTESTCSKAGKTVYTCSKCSDSYTETIPVLDHSYEAVVTAPTCTADGYTTHTCSACGHSYIDNRTASAGHSYKAVVTAPTCTAGGYTTHTCSTCGHSYIDNRTASTGHSYTATITKQPTCSAAGVKTYTCSGCNSSYTEGISSTGHSYSAVVTEPTCSNAGFTTHTCSACGSSYTTDHTSTVDHNYVGGKCYWCGTAEPVTQLDYYLIGYINGADYGCEGDSQNMGEYKFVDGKLTATFETDSYVFIKTTNNTNWYMTDGWLGTDVTSATLYNTINLGADANKLFVPGGVEITFTLVVNTDGSLTLNYVAAEKPVLEKFDITLANLTLGNDLTLYFYIPADACADWTDCYAVITKPYANGNEALTVTVPFESWVPGFKSGGQELYQVAFKGIAAKEMADEVSIVIYKADGEAISNEGTESIRSYLERMMDKKKDDAISMRLAVDMLNYGAEAQKYFGYNTGDLANAHLTDEQKACGTTTAPECVNGNVKGANAKGSNLTLESSILMNAYFNGLTEDMYAKVSFTNYRGEPVEATLDAHDGSRFVVNQIVVADARQLVTVTVYNADGSVYGTITDSVESYTARARESGAKGLALYEAIMCFADSAKIYLQNR